MTLLLLFARDAVPSICICDDAKDIINGKLHQKLNDVACYLKELELYTTWSTATEREIKELKKGVGH